MECPATEVALKNEQWEEVVNFLEWAYEAGGQSDQQVSVFIIAILFSLGPRAIAKGSQIAKAVEAKGLFWMSCGRAEGRRSQRRQKTSTVQQKHSLRICAASYC